MVRCSASRRSPRRRSRILRSIKFLKLTGIRPLPINGNLSFIYFPSKYSIGATTEVFRFRWSLLSKVQMHRIYFDVRMSLAVGAMAVNKPSSTGLIQVFACSQMNSLTCCNVSAGSSFSKSKVLWKKVPGCVEAVRRISEKSSRGP